MLDIEKQNRDQIVSQKIYRAKPCSKCGTLKDVVVTYAYPIEKGGLQNGWNHTILCKPCRILRKKKHDLGFAYVAQNPNYYKRKKEQWQCVKSYQQSQSRH